MGSRMGQGESSERPQTRLEVRPYCIDLTEVTVRDYTRCVQAGVCAEAPVTVRWRSLTTGQISCRELACNGGRPDRADHPANCVDWSMAAAYCRWANGRLPTEAEWELAARGMEVRTYPWGEGAPTADRLNAAGIELAEQLPPRCRTRGEATSMYERSDGFPFTAPVGSFPAGSSPFGIVDLSGNVMEWTADWYGPYPGGTSPHSGGPAAGQQRVIRGGSWLSHLPGWVTGTDRARAVPSDRNSTVGFRCVRDVVQDGPD